MYFEIPLIPVGKLNMVARRGGGLMKPAKQRERDEELDFYLQQHRPPAPLLGPIELGLTCYMPLPRSWSEAKKHRMTGEPYTAKPDLDNMFKMLQDRLKACGFYRDDAQVYRYYPASGKYYSHNPRWEVKITEAKR